MTPNWKYSIGDQVYYEDEPAVGTVIGLHPTQRLYWVQWSDGPKTTVAVGPGPWYTEACLHEQPDNAGIG